MTIDLISRFEEKNQVIGWVKTYAINHVNHDRIDVYLNGKLETVEKLFKVVSEQLKTLGCKVNSDFTKDYKTLLVGEFRHLGTPEELKIILEDELQKAGVIIQSQE